MKYIKYSYNVIEIYYFSIKFMQEINLTEQEVDSLVLSLLENHSSDVDVNEKEFLELLKYSLSLNTMEKKRVIDAVPTLSQFQFDELTKVFSEERTKFKDLAKEHPDDIKKLVKKQQTEWIELGDIYKIETEVKAKENENKDKIDDIKASLGL